MEPAPQNLWTRERLDSLIGETETLTLEFKSCRALVWSEAGDRAAKLAEAAKDAAAMANEQGGTIIYGIEETRRGRQRRAVRLEDGFDRGEASREWYLQFIRDRVHPPLPDIDAQEVDLYNGRFALVIHVPQARGVARQTEDLLFWRRDAQGCHPMTVQEIEDVRSRAARPQLTLSARAPDIRPRQDGVEAKLQIEIENASSTTASFAVLTLGISAGGTVLFPSRPEWEWFLHTDAWHVARAVIASGSSRRWSPITPGYVLAAEEITLAIPTREADALGAQRAIGLVRLDHDGGSSVWAMRFRTLPGTRVILSPATLEDRDNLGRPEPLPKIFVA